MMKEFLANIKPPKYLRYLFFIAYSWYRSFKSERDDAHLTATILIALPNYLLIFIIDNISFVLLKTNSVNYSNTEILFFGIIISLLHYGWFIHLKKWRYYIEEFRYIKRKKQRIGLIYLFISLVLSLLPTILDLIFGIDLLDR